ncbi:MAG: MoaD/ThiS family protein [Synechocystis sp.]|nr:MoaD/ThiS family protein [Synechocystis sp.]
MVHSPAALTITIKLFAVYRDCYGEDTQQRQISADTTVSDLLDQVLTEHPELASWRSLTRFGVNCQFVPPDTVLQAGDEVVFIPPVSGG